jgi:hypothetical protein
VYGLDHFGSKTLLLDISMHITTNHIYIYIYIYICTVAHQLILFNNKSASHIYIYSYHYFFVTFYINFIFFSINHSIRFQCLHSKTLNTHKSEQLLF